MQVGRNIVNATIKTSEKLYRTNYVASAQLDESIISNISKPARVLRWIDLNSGEHLNNAFTAVGTAAVAPYFIVNNPFAKKEDPKVKAYSAWRQPISATIQLLCLTPVAVGWNNQVDNWATFGRWKDMDLSMKPLASTLNKQLTSEYVLKKSQFENSLVEFLDPSGNPINKFPTKKEFITNRMKEIHSTKFSDELARLRAAKLIENDIWSKINYVFDGVDEIKLTQNDIKEMKKNNFIPDFILDKLAKVNALSKEELKVLSEGRGLCLSDKILDNTKNLLKPDDINAGRTAVMKKLFAKDATTGVNQLNVAELPKGFEKFEDLATPVGRKFLKKQGLVPNKIIKQIENEGFAFAEETLSKKLESESLTKLFTSTAQRRMSAQLAREMLDLQSEFSVEQLNEAKMLMSKEFLKVEIKKLKELEEIEILKMENSNGKITTSRLLEPIRNAKIKLERVLNSDCRIDLIKNHGSSIEAVGRSVRIKKYLMAKIQKAENVHKGFKQFTGIPVAIVSVVAACYALNWLYPRFMEKFLPDLANAKADAGVKKSDAQNVTGLASIKQDTVKITAPKTVKEAK